MPQELGFSRYGKTCFGEEVNVTDYKGNKSIKDTIINYFKKIYRGKNNKVRTMTYNDTGYKETFTIEKKNVTYKTIQDYILAIIDVINQNRAKTLDSKNANSIASFCSRGKLANNIKVFKNNLRQNYENIKRAGEEDVYFNVAGNIKNENIKNVVNLHDVKEKNIKIATVSQMDGIHDGTFVNYQELHKRELREGIKDDEHIINNRVPTYFQTREYWSFLRYGLSSSDLENTVYISNEDKKEYEYKDKKYSYGTFYESSCGASSAAMVLSYLYDTTITPVDVRNMMEKHIEVSTNSNTTYIYRSVDGDSGTRWDAVGYKIPQYFNATNIGINDTIFTSRNKDNGSIKASTNIEKKKILKYLIQGNPIIAITHGSESASYPEHSSYFTTMGHYIVIAGVDISNLNNKVGRIIDSECLSLEIESMSKQQKADLIYNYIADDELDDIRIYCEDSAYWHQDKKETKYHGMTRKLTISDFVGNSGAGVDGMFIYSLNNNSSKIFENSVMQWEYFNYYKNENIDYKENFTPQSYKIYGEDPLKSKKNDLKGLLIGNSDTWRKDSKEEHLLEGYRNEDKINDN